MDLSVRDVARLFNVPENTVYRWIRTGALPAHRVHDQYRFNRVELQEWAASSKHPVSPELFAPEGSISELPSLSLTIERGGVFYRVPGSTRNDVLAAVSRLPGVPSEIDRDLLFQLLSGRESIVSTAVGDGIAIPHPRDPLVVRIDVPLILLCFLEEAVDFRAADGRPVHVLFLVLSPNVRTHLQLLSKLAYALHDEMLRDLLHRTAPPEAVLERLRAIEAAVTDPTPIAEAGAGDPLHQDEKR